jgi:hypothetical protein
MAEVSDYTNLITSEYINQPNFLAFAELVLQGFVDGNNEISAVPSMLDVDSAVGQQLDFIGAWIGLSRTLRAPLTGVFFSFDTANLGFDQGIIDGPSNASTGILSLDDATYRQMLYLEIAANSWDGSNAGAETILANALIGSSGTNIFIEDNQNMSITIGVTGTLPSALFQALLSGGYFNLRPAAVQISGVLINSAPFFGFDIENYNVSGLDIGIIS